MTEPQIYETDESLQQYLLFHYGAPEQILPYEFGPKDAVGFPSRCVTECIDSTRLSDKSRALDLGCSVGRSSYELAKTCGEVIGIDKSKTFIRAAEAMKNLGELKCRRIEEGDAYSEISVKRPSGVDYGRIRFEVGDACALDPSLGLFDVILMSNLLDRVPHPRAMVEQIAAFVSPGGQLILLSPYSWLSDFTAPDEWLGGKMEQNEPIFAFDSLSAILDPAFELSERKNVPFLIREHRRKFQWSVAEASRWIRKA